MNKKGQGSVKKLILGLSVALVLIGVMAVKTFIRTAYVFPVMMYHYIDENEGKSKISVSPQTFASEMEFLSNHHYNVVSPDKVVAYLEGRERVPPKTVAITFDDGMENNYKYAYPILKKYNFPATIFVITSKIGQPGWLSRAQIREMSDSGLITIGSHTVFHKWLPHQGSKRLESELVDSKRVLEGFTGKSVDYLCYPLGAQDDRVKRFVKASGYKAAFATNPGAASANNDLFAIKRVRISHTALNPIVMWFETSGYYTWVKERRDK